MPMFYVGDMPDWIATLSLIFGGCCSNALTLEQLTSQYPQSGTLITFAQFLFISIYGLSNLLTFSPLPRLKTRHVPVRLLLLQALLLCLVSLLNNAAFAYHIPMPVHIIFRSGGLVISMLMGRLILGRRYTLLQTVSVLLVTTGILLTTLSASRPKHSASPAEAGPETHISSYAVGIAILTLALVLSGLLGIVQDGTYSRYVRAPAHPQKQSSGSVPGKDAANADAPVPWQESLFYLHFFSMPMFVFLRKDLASQFRVLNAGPRVELSLPIPHRLFPEMSSSTLSEHSWMLSVPAPYIPLLLNTVTQVLCVSGVHRLTARVTSLTVTLVLAVRKAASLIISVVLFSSAGRARMDERGLIMMWAGAALVFAGTIGYSLGAGSSGRQKIQKSKAE
ncbi:UAA transporter [Obba rivulosa]|uniref:UAA transporter n=1 Tax=Obba rivulosa TaxID=1052685 RepID=A0A8E2DF51_9APHY|nr:UAA transporter [Obba rivulosa]